MTLWMIKTMMNDTHLAYELLVTVDVQAPVEGAALQLVQEDVLSPEERGRLALPRMAEAGL